MGGDGWCDKDECCQDKPTSDQWSCWYHGADGGGWRSAGETTTGGTKFCPAGTQARSYYDSHCMGGWCGDFTDSECCQQTCWASGWRESGDVSGTYQCPATAEARGSTDGHDCGDRCGESSECCKPKCGLSGFADQSACPAGAEFKGEWNECWSDEARSTGMCSQSDCCRQTCSGAGYTDNGDNQCSVGMTSRSTDEWYESMYHYECKTADCSDAECCGVPSTGSGTCWDAGFRDSTAVPVEGACHHPLRRRRLAATRPTAPPPPCPVAGGATAYDCQTMEIQIFSNLACSGSPDVSQSGAVGACMATPSDVLSGRFFDVSYDHWGIQAKDNYSTTACSGYGKDTCEASFDSVENCTEARFGTCNQADLEKGSAWKVVCVDMPALVFQERTFPCPAGQQARSEWDGHMCSSGTCFESDCCDAQCWASGWRDNGDASGQHECHAGQRAHSQSDGHSCSGGVCDVDDCCYYECWASGWRSSGDTSGTEQCPADKRARHSGDNYWCARRPLREWLGR